jgi:hypothetical protein
VTTTSYRFLDDPEEIKKNSNLNFKAVNKVIPAEPCTKDRFLN